MTRSREHPVLDRPLEFSLGFCLAAAGLVIIVSTLILGVPEFAPRYLAKLHDALTIIYALLMTVGGGSSMVGLVLQSRPRSTILGRGISAIGCFLTSGIAATYAADLAWGELQSPRNTLLMAFLTGIVVGSLIRCWRLLQMNRIVLRVVSDAASEGGN